MMFMYYDQMLYLFLWGVNLHLYREEMFKQKRAFMGEGATNTPAGAVVGEAQNMQMNLGPQN